MAAGLRMLVGLLVAAATTLYAGESAAPLRVLIFSGKNNHNWQQTTPVLQKMYTDSGRFSVEVTNDPAQCDEAAFAKCDVVVSNWTNWPDVNKRVWPEKTEKAFLDFVRNGRGVVMIHAASSVFYTWPEFQELVGSWWKMGQTGHGAVHKFTVTIADKEHPITRGLKDFAITDELWHREGTAGELRVLCTAFSDKAKGGSGLNEPVAHWREFGKGRCFHITLGHDGAAMQNAGFQALTLRGTEWAATGKVTLAAADNLPPPADAFKELAAYRAGQGRQAATAVAETVKQAANDAARRAEVAAKLVALLGAPEATKDAKGFACEQLSIIGGEGCVPALATLLADEELSLPARLALERIGGETAATALREALGKTKGATQAGTLNSIAQRRDAKACEAIAGLAGAGDEVVRAAALAALGKIGTPEAAKALSAARKGRPAELKGLDAARYDDACLQCARQLLADGKAAEAAAIFAELYEGTEKPPARAARVAALRGLLAAQPEQSQARALKALTEQDAQIVAAAADFVAMSSGSEATKAYAAQLANLPPASKLALLEALARRGDSAALPAVMAAVNDKEATLRLAALQALGGVADASALPLLIGKATTGQGAERQTAQQCLRRLPIKGVDEAILAALKGADAATRAELIKVLAARATRSAIPALLEAAADAEAGVRAAALQGLRLASTVDDLPGLLKLLGKAPAEGDRASLEPAILALCRNIKEREAQAAPVLAALPETSAAGRAALLRLLGRLGGAQALAAVRADLKHADENVRDAAIRSLVDWADAGPAADVLAIAASKEATLAQHVLALRGYTRMVTLPGTRSRTEMAALLQEALKIARRDEEKQLVQSAIEKSQWAVNLALSGTASSPDGLDDDGASKGDQAAIDGNPETYWDELDDQKLYRLQVAWKEPVSIRALRIMGHGHHEYAPKDFDVLCDDKVAKEVRGATYASNLLVVELPPAKCSKLELKITGCYGRSPAIRELEVFDEGKIPPPPPLNIARQGKASSPDGLKSDGGATGDQAAIDGDPETYWDKTDNQKLYRLVVDFPKTVRVSAIRVLGYEHHDFAPKDFDILCDGKAVKEVREAVYKDNWLLVEFPPLECKAVELKITGYYGGSPAIRELQILSPNQ